MTLLVITTAGKGKETDAITDGLPMQKLNKLVIGSGPPPLLYANQIAMTQLVNKVYETTILTKDRQSPATVKFTASIPENVECKVTEIGLTLEDGTLFAYAPYQPENPDGGGLYKGRGFALQISVILSREQQGTLEFTYSPIDVQEVAQRIEEQARTSIDLYLQAYFISIAANVSGLSSNVQKLQSQINSLLH